MIWVTHMKTTIEIADGLLRQARRLAARRHTTLRAVIEEALREAIARDGAAEVAGAIRTHTFRGEGLQPGLSWADWGSVRERAYEGRGG